MKPPSKSMFQPRQGVGQDFLDENRKLIAQIDRRNVLRGSLTAGGLTLLGDSAVAENAQLRPCTVSGNAKLQTVLRAVSEWNDRVQAFIFRPDHLAPTYSEAQVVKPPRFNAHYDVEDVKPVDLATWKLEFAGLIADKRPWTLDQIYAFPEQELIIKHICVEGWDYIGQWSGPNLRRFLTQIGADLTAKYVAFYGNDDYMECIDMASALHPQSILATKYAGEPITAPFGAPLRLRTAVKLGYKNPKWIRAIEVTNVYPGGFWEEQGFNWFAGL
jgi:DMSO/TMAO reductase YedYZ molybdopterin-dependent catalytic subunit